ncbi:hypothetical protein ACFQPA_10990 [Halomarina halobia]|uniref:RanBP2-type domain-containing protein n=1 Tax=Halomarina halobia TaxID=3033386 RepID=A0ABD6AAE0_9EURY|nr:hypothetical protein [Halomarina sp. PSR21]
MDPGRDRDGEPSGVRRAAERDVPPGGTEADESVTNPSDDVRVRRVGNPPPVPDVVEWRCPHCAMHHPRNSPPCSRCGNPTLERVAVVLDPPEETVGLRARALAAGRAAVPIAGLMLAVVGGAVVLYGGLAGTNTQAYVASGELPPSARILVVAGVAVLAVGAFLLFAGTRQPREPL